MPIWLHLKTDPFSDTSAMSPSQAGENVTRKAQCLKEAVRRLAGMASPVASC